MMEYIFKSIILTSLIGTALAGILALVRPITKKLFPSSWHYYMWLVVLVAMVLPVRFTCPDSANVHLSQMTEVNVSQVKTDGGNYQQTQQLEHTPQEALVEDNQNFASEQIIFFASSRLSITPYIWFLGFLFLISARILRYLIFLRRLRNNSNIVECPELEKFTKKKVIVRSSNAISSPLITGLLKPTLLLPDVQMSSEQLNNVLDHEVTHLKRHDILYKWFVSIVKCVHWFNPVVYYVSRQVNMDCEISCDLTVVGKMTKEQEIGYINTILTLLSAGNSPAIPLTTGMTGNKEMLKRRFIMIKNKMRFSKKAIIISVISAILVLSGTILASGLLNGTVLKQFENKVISLNTDEKVNGNFNFLILGVDEKNRADTIMVLSFKENNITALSIPRDTSFSMDIEYAKARRISDILAEENGDQKVVDAISGKLDIPITYYAKLNLNAVKEIVDRLDGIEFDVPMDMVYEDPHKGLSINLKKGVQTLNGEAVCQLLQYRHSNTGTGYKAGDINRIEVGQQVIKEIISQKLNKDYIDKAPEVFKVIAKNIVTNYSFENFSADLRKISNPEKTDVAFYIIPGETAIAHDGVMVYKIDYLKANNHILNLFRYSDAKNAAVNTSNQAENSGTENNDKPILLADKETMLVSEEEKSKPVSEDIKLSWPCDSVEISHKFGTREHPITNEKRSHNGVDIVTTGNADVYSSINGTVTEVGFDSELGNYVVISSGDNVKTKYASLLETTVKTGDTVKQKDVIGKSGKSGQSTGEHLHFEVIIDNNYCDPEKIIN